MLTRRTHFYRSDSADKVVQGEGKFEEIVVASNEITASTVQLVSEQYCFFELINSRETFMGVVCFCCHITN